MTAKKNTGSRTMQIVHMGTTIMVREGHDGDVELRTGDHSVRVDLKFPAACRYALKWIMKNGGDMRGSYER